MFENIGDKAVKDALVGIDQRIAAIENSPLVLALTQFLQNLNQNGVTIHVGDIVISSRNTP